ncbi:unnamed protein product [Meloidogyne enterolobii]|uniref:Uncharacterized protein n=1 Tax=Meloidogyne enterolobii TaxID=390850 RepID=A0ACB1A8L1_MELEN
MVRETEEKVRREANSKLLPESFLSLNLNYNFVKFLFHFSFLNNIYEHILASFLHYFYSISAAFRDTFPCSSGSILSAVFSFHYYLQNSEFLLIYLYSFGNNFYYFLLFSLYSSGSIFDQIFS